jgi:hypothetical protein
MYLKRREDVRDSNKEQKQKAVELLNSEKSRNDREKVVNL